MSLEHKAYAFDWTRFEFDLLPILTAALATNDATELEKYIDLHRAELTDPYEGEPLPSDWRTMLESGDVQEYGDFALTRFYDPADCRGIGYEWACLSEELPEPVARAMLGFPIGPREHLFDPGRCGSYFQTAECVRRSLVELKPMGSIVLTDFVSLLERCAAGSQGLYTTF